MVPEEKLKHLEFIQNVITRLNTNSFQVKELAVTLTSALLAVFASTQNPLFVLTAVFPAFVLWFLDAYYLMQERRFRGLYDEVAGVIDNPRPIKPFSMQCEMYVGGKYSFWSSFTSTTVCRLYLSIAIGLIGLFAFLQCWQAKGQ